MIPIVIKFINDYVSNNISNSNNGIADVAARLLECAQLYVYIIFMRSPEIQKIYLIYNEIVI
jgi:hypothetical protein